MLRKIGWAVLVLAGLLLLAFAWLPATWSFFSAYPEIWSISGILIVVLSVLWKGPKWQTSSLNFPTEEDRANFENEARRTLAQIIGGAVVLAGLYSAWRNVGVIQEGQITDLFTKAINQLGENGPEKLAIRLGGIYALERIARDSERDHWPIMEILTAYVREKAPKREARQETSEKVTESESRVEYAERLPRIPADIQAILTVIGRRIVAWDPPEMGAILNLNNTDLCCLAEMGEANLSWARLTGIRLIGAALLGAKLIGANLTGADLSRAWLKWANLSGAILRKANLSGAILGKANLEGADLRGVT